METSVFWEFEFKAGLQYEGRRRGKGWSSFFFEYLSLLELPFLSMRIEFHL